MLFYEIKIGDKEYKLRLNTRNTVLLEKSLGCNPLSIFGKDNEPVIPTVTAMVAILHAALQQYQHNITTNDAFDLFDEWLADGNTPADFVSIIIEIYKVSGLIATEVEENEEKN